MSQSIKINCTNCGDNTVELQRKGNWDGIMFFGKCPNTACVQEQYLCKLCYDYVIANQAPGRSGGGRKGGIFSSVKTARKHYNNNTHKCASEQSSDEIAVCMETSPIGDDSNEITTPSNCDPELNNNVHDFTNAVGFDEKSSSPKFYSYEQQCPGMGA